MLAAAALGLLIGVVLGGLGGGGGVLTVPALVYLLDQPAQDATTSSVVVVGISAVAGVLARARSGSVDWRTALEFGLAGVPAALLGTLLNRHVAEPVLLLSFAATTLVAAALMLAAPPRPDPDVNEPPSASTPRDGPSAALAARPRQGRGARCRSWRAASSSGSSPVSSASAAASSSSPHWSSRCGCRWWSRSGRRWRSSRSTRSRRSFPGSPRPISTGRSCCPSRSRLSLGTLLGKRVADRLSGSTLRRAFAVMLILVGVGVAVESLVSL